MKRRDFLQAAGAILGCSLLSGCSTENVGGLDSFGPSVNSYSFIPLIRSGASLGLPNGATPKAFPGSAMINDLGQVVYHCIDSNGKMGLYKMQLQLSGQPGVLSNRLLLLQGDSLPGGRRAKELEMNSLNNRGNDVVRVVTDQGHQQLVRITPAGPQNILAFNQTVNPSEAALPAGKRDIFSQSIGDFELLDDDSLLVVAHYAPKNSTRSRQGLYLLTPDGGDPRLLARSGELLPDSTELLGLFGLIDAVGDRDHLSFTHQAFAQGPSSDSTSSTPTPARHPGALVTGLETTPSSRTLAAADPQLNVNPAVRNRILSGGVYHGPRLGAGGQVLAIVQTGGDNATLSVNGVPVLSTGDRTPTGRTITGFYGPALAANGLGFIPVQLGDDGSELLLVSSAGLRTICSEGAKVGDAILSHLGFGLVRNQVDSQGRVVFSVRYQDGSTGLILGLPA